MFFQKVSSQSYETLEKIKNAIIRSNDQMK